MYVLESTFVTCFLRLTYNELSNCDKKLQKDNSHAYLYLAIYLYQR